LQMSERVFERGHLQFVKHSHLMAAKDFYDRHGGKAIILARFMPLVRTFTENLMAYALGRRTEYFDQPAIRAIAKSAEANHYKMSSFILGVVKSDAFRMRRVEPEATTTETTKAGSR